MELKLSIGKTTVATEISKDDAQALIRELFMAVDQAPTKQRRGAGKPAKVAAKASVGAKKRGRPAKVAANKPALAKKPRAPRGAKKPPEAPQT